MGERQAKTLSPTLRLAALAGRILPDRVVMAFYRLGPISRLLRATLNRSAPAGLVEVKIAGGPLTGMRMLLNLQTEKDLWLGSYEIETLAAIADLGRAGMVAYDIGAHIGYVSLALARVCGAHGRVVAFEPLPDNVSRIRANLELNKLENCVTLEPAAVGKTTAPGQFLVHQSPGMGKLDGSQGREATYSGLQTVTVVALDDYAYGSGTLKPDLIKIDIEGGEVDALLGMRRLLQEVKPILLVEIHGREAAEGCWEVLRASDYKVGRLAPRWTPVRSAAELDRKAYILAKASEQATPSSYPNPSLES